MYHEKSNANSLVRLIKRLMSMKLDEGADLEVHIAHIAEAFQQLHDIGKELKTDDWHVAVLLGSLPESFSTLVTALESRETELTTAVVEQRLLDEWKKRKDKASNEADGTMALRVSTNVSTKDKQNIVCYFCKEKGHYKPKCPKFKKYLKDKKEKGSTNKQQANLVETPEKSDFLFSTSKFHNGWIVDSGATSHVTSNRSMFAEFNKNHRENIFVANGQRVVVEGIGTVRIQITNSDGKRQSVKIQNVLYVPSISGNLLSVRKLVAEGFSVNFTPNGNCNIAHGDVQVTTAVLQDNLYVLKEAEKYY